MRLLPPRGRRAIWFHAASVGEVSTIAPVVAEVRKMNPDVPIVISSMTRGGASRAREKLGDAEVALAPFDFLPCMRRFVSALEPSCLVIGETEIWPNLVFEARRHGAPVIMVNGRISNKSYPRYKLVRTFIRGILDGFDLMLMRTPVDAERILSLGADPGRVEVIGNTKYDILPRPASREARDRTRSALGLPPDAAVLTLGSAREGECEIVLGALAAAGVKSLARIIVAPRHLNLVQEIEGVCRTEGLSCLTLTDLEGQAGAGGADVIVLAQMGRLMDVYAISDVGIVGGTFRPFGGHNPLEPASQGCITLVGPHIANIRDDIDYLTSRSCAFVVNEAGLGATVVGLLSDPGRRDEIRLRAVRAVEEKKGIAAKCVEAMVRRNLLVQDGPR
jgi:3-deoxy-D-manno-octulosonic-acid transferase